MKNRFSQNIEQETHAGAWLVVRTVAIFLIFSTLLHAVDFVPERTVTEAHENKASQLANNNKSTESQIRSEKSQITNSSSEHAYSTVPVKVVIQAIGMDTPIGMPMDDSDETLNRALLKGAVLYPGSGNFGENGNVLIFGHSSHLPVVHNDAYRTFNDIRTLQNGDEIRIVAGEYVYVYEVRTVYVSNAEDAMIRFDATEPLLTLATCNTFGEKEERWVVESIFKRKSNIY